MHLLAVRTSSLLPTGHCTFIQRKGDHNGLNRTAMRQQGRHLHKQPLWMLDAVDGRPFSLAEALAAAPALVALLLAAVNDYVTTTDFPAGVTARVRAELFLRVHLSTPLFGNKSVPVNPLFFQSRYPVVLPEICHQVKTVIDTLLGKICTGVDRFHQR
jgi:hypothetical protein